MASGDLSAGHVYGERVARESVSSRYDAMMQSNATDDGAGVPYQIVYGLTPPRELGPAPVVWVEDTGRWFAGPDGRPAHAHGVVRVVTDRHEAERKLALGAHIDPLTGVLNRAQFSEQLQPLASTQRTQPQSLHGAARRGRKSLRPEPHLWL